MSTSCSTLRSLAVALATLGLTITASAQIAPSEAAPGSAAPEPPFTKVTATGSGCREGTWTAIPTHDGKSFVVRFNKFTVGLGFTGETGLMNCLVSIELPAGRSYYTLGDVYASVYVDVLLNSTVRVTSKAWFDDATELGSEDVVDVPVTGARKWYLPHPSRSGASASSGCGDAHTLNLSVDVAILPMPDGKPPVYVGAVWVKDMPTDSADGIALTRHPCQITDTGVLQPQI